jgi:hypothetical protein
LYQYWWLKIYLAIIKKERKMKTEIDKTHYCVGDFYSEGCFRWDEEDPEGGCKCTLEKCKLYHRKWPTPEQYKAEYREEWPDGNAVYYCAHSNFPGWSTWWYDRRIRDTYVDIVCASTTWGKPPDEWRPE